jgi:hypothetical protein
MCKYNQRQYDTRTYTSFTSAPVSLHKTKQYAENRTILFQHKVMKTNWCKLLYKDRKTQRI